MEPLGNEQPIPDLSPDQIQTYNWNEIIKAAEVIVSNGSGAVPTKPMQSPNFVSGSTGWRLDTNGNLEANDGNFRGDITGSSGTFTGTITATGGAIGGFDIGADYIRDVANSMGLASTVTGGDDVRFWAGDSYANRATAPFNVTEAGIVNASKIIISGATSTFNGSLVTNVQPRAEVLWSRDYVFVGYYNDGLTATVDAGVTITRQVLSTLFAINGAANADARLSIATLGSTVSGGTMDWGTGDYEFSCSAQFRDTTAQDAFLGLFNGGGEPSDNLAETAKHIGFYLQDGTMYASNANGTTQTTTDISASITITNMNDLRFVYDTGVNIKFYVNDTLVATHTTNLPATAGGNFPAPVFFLNASDGDANMIIKNNYLVTLQL